MCVASLSKEPGQAAVCQHLTSGLTLSAIVHLVIGSEYVAPSVRIVDKAARNAHV